MFWTWIFRLFTDSKLKQCQKQKQVLEQQLGSYQGSVSVGQVKSEIPGKEVWDLFSKAFPNADFYPLDGKYRATDLATIRKITEEFTRTTREYRRHYFDCENHAFCYKAHLDGRYMLNQDAINYSTSHGFVSFFYIPENEVKLLEPQGGRIFDVLEAENKDPSVEMPEEVYIEGLGKRMRLDDAIKEGMYQTIFYQV